MLMIGTSSAYAADPATQDRDSSVAPMQAFSWTGPYAGINAGVGFAGRDNVHTRGQAAPNIANIEGGARPGFVHLDRIGATAGGQIGYNYQFGQYVAGVEADIGFTDFSDRRTIGTAQLMTGAALNNRFRSKIDYLGTARARLGVTMDRALVYATGGLAYGRAEHSVTMFGPTGNVQFDGGREKTEVGFAGGAGVEYAITPRVSMKTEYLFYDLGRRTVNVAVIPGSGGAGTGYDSRFRDNGSLLRVGLNMKF